MADGQEDEAAPEEVEEADSGEAEMEGEDDAVPTGFSVDEPEQEPQTFETEESDADLTEGSAVEAEPADDAVFAAEAPSDFEEGPPAAPEAAPEDWEGPQEQAEAFRGEDQPSGGFEQPQADDLEADPSAREDEDFEAPDEAFEQEAETEFDEAADTPTDDEGFVPEEPSPEEESKETSPAGYDEAELPGEAVAETGSEASAQEPLENKDPTEESAPPGPTTAYVLEEELEDLQHPPEPEAAEAEPLPEVGPSPAPAVLTMYVDGREEGQFALEAERLVLGALPAENSEETSFRPDIDVGDAAEEADIWRRHATLYRQNKNYTLFVNADGATQINDTHADLGTFVDLEDGDVFVLGGRVGFRFELPDETDFADPGAAGGDEPMEAEPIASEPIENEQSQGTFGEPPAEPEFDDSEEDWGEPGFPEDEGSQGDFEEEF